MHHIINVSNFKNNSGLFSLGLAVSLALEKNPDAYTSNIPLFVKSMKVSDVFDTNDPGAEQLKLAVHLRLSMAAALRDDTTFKEMSLHRFKQYCLNLDAATPVGMDNFVKANSRIISILKSEIKKLSSYQYVISRFTEPSISNNEIDSLRENLEDCMNQHYFDEVIVHRLLNDTNDIKTVTDIFKLCKIFSIVWPTINQTGNNIQKTKNAIEDWFLLRANEIISSEHDKNERFKKFILLGLCKTLIGNFPDVLNNAIELSVPRYLEKNSKFIYNCYVEYMAQGYEMLSGEELKCLATAWDINLIVDGVSNYIGGNATNRSLTVKINKMSGNRWGILADDSLLEPIPEEQDDQFKTLMILSESLREIITGTASRLNIAFNHEIIRGSYAIYRNKGGELIPKPIDKRKSQGFNVVVESVETEKKKALEAETNTTLWSFMHNKSAYATRTTTNISVTFVTGLTIECNAAVAGMYGAEEGYLLARAIQAGRAAGTTWEAFIGATLVRTVTSPYLWGPLVILETYMLSRRKINEFSASIEKALVLYKKGITEHDQEALRQVDTILRAELGYGENRRWLQTRISIKVQASNDQYALIYYMLGSIANQVNKEESKSMFDKAYYYAKDQDVKWLSLFGATREIFTNIQSDKNVDKLEKLSQEELFNKNISELQLSNSKMVDNAFMDVVNTLYYIFSALCFSSTAEALENIDSILKNNDINIVKHLKPYGRFCELAYVFIQGVCFELKSIEIKNRISENGGELESDMDQESKTKLKAQEKFIECISIILESEQDMDKITDDRLKTVFISEIRSYCNRFFKRCKNDGANEDGEDVVSRLIYESESDGSPFDRRARELAAKKHRNRSLAD